MTETINLNEARESEPLKNRLKDISRNIEKSRKVVVVTGAGISCNAGIPDFRSKDGLYNLVKHQYPNAVVKGKDLFDAILFSNPQSIAVFYTFMAALRTCISNAKPTETHKFIHFLKKKKKLLRCYTQNIDNLEQRIDVTTTSGECNNNNEEGSRSTLLSLGVDPKKKPDVVQLHGDIDKLKCMQCAQEYDWFPEAEVLCDQGAPPACPSCVKCQEERVEAGKRAVGVGSLRPNIVLYGEEHPNGDLIGRCTDQDLKSKPDCLIIMGTSLKVNGIKKLVRSMAKTVKQKNGSVILVNDTPLCQSAWEKVIDFHIEGDCDQWVSSLHDSGFFRVQTTLPVGVSKKKAPSLVRKPTKATPTNSENNVYDEAIAARKVSSAAKKLLSPPSTPQKPHKHKLDIDLLDRQPFDDVTNTTGANTKKRVLSIEDLEKDGKKKLCT